MSRTSGTFRRLWPLCSHPPGMCSASSGRGVRSGTRSTGCRMGGRSRRRSARPGLSVVDRPPATSPAGRPRPGWRTCCTRLGAERCRARSGAGSSSREAAEEWLRFIREDRERKPSTLVDYQSALRAHLLPAFGDRELESITPEEIELWRRGLKGLSNRSKNKLLIQLHGIFRRAQIVWNVPVNPLARIEKHPMRPSGRHPGLLAGGGLGPGPRVRLGAGRRAVLDGRLHGSAHG